MCPTVLTRLYYGERKIANKRIPIVEIQRHMQ